MKEAFISIDQTGRIVLPKSVRRELDIKAGTLFKVSVQGTDVILKPSRAKSGFIRKGKALVFSTEGDTTLDNEMVNEVLAATRREPAL